MEAALHAARDDFDRFLHSESSPGTVRQHTKLLEVVRGAAPHPVQGADGHRRVDGESAQSSQRAAHARTPGARAVARSGDVGPHGADSETLGGAAPGDATARNRAKSS